jgi:Uma2 family endonuclease
MALSVEKKRVSVEEYLRQEEASPERHEFHDGEVLAMAGNSYDHSVIVSNLNRAIGNRLKGKPCRPLNGNIRVSIPSISRYLYPDLIVFCDRANLDPADRSTGSILSPRVVFEVLSKSTEAYDRGKKFSYYRELESMQEYVLVSQYSATIETFFRQNGIWTFGSAQAMDAELILRSVDITIPLKEIYEDVEFPPPNLSLEINGPNTP